jgi:hypothetical protein
MRDAINNNPKVQIGVIGVLVLVVGLFLMMGMSKKSPTPPATSASAAPGVSSPTAGGTSAPVTPSPGGTTPPSSSGGSAGAVAPPVSGGTVTPSALIPGPGLPRPVIDAWKRGNAVVLLIVQKAGIDDKLVTSSVRSLSRDRGVSVFIAPARDVARYSRITQGVGVEQVPALVVVRPRRESGSVPQAQVRYGFRDSQSVVQAVHDALYHGSDNLPYYPR